MGGANDQIMKVFKTKDYNKPKRIKTGYGGKKKQYEEKN